MIKISNNKSAASLALLVFILIAFLIGLRLLKQTDINYGDMCVNECKRFDYTYYKVDFVKTRGYINRYCWCIDEQGKPVSIGKIE